MRDKRRLASIIVMSICSILVMRAPAAAGETMPDLSGFTQISGADSVEYKPDGGKKPAIVYADMDGDKIDEMVVAVQMEAFDDLSGQDYPVDEEDDRTGYPATFAYVYRTDGKRNPTVLLHTIHLGDLLGAWATDHRDKVIEKVDLNNDGKMAVALWSTRGAHYHGLVIIGMRNGRVVAFFNGGSGNQLVYEPRKNKNVIIAGDAETAYGAGDAYLIWREDAWEWNGNRFAYSKAKSSVTAMPSDEGHGTGDYPKGRIVDKFTKDDGRYVRVYYEHDGRSICQAIRITKDTELSSVRSDYDSIKIGDTIYLISVDGLDDQIAQANKILVKKEEI